jgi:pimeloyl-ACP methyl ester carboxylesterase
MAVFERDGVYFSYEVIGQGPSVAFCHGLTGDRKVIKELLGEIPSHQVIVWDCRGHGDTEPMGPPEKFTFRSFAEDLEALLDNIGVETCVVGGVSMGAGVSASFATRWPERVRGLVLARPAWLDKSAPENLHILLKAADLLGLEDLDHAFRLFCDLPEFKRRSEVTGETASEIWAQFTKPKAVERRMRMERMTRSRPIVSWEETSILTMPALVIGCDRDPMHPLEFAKIWKDHLPSARLVQIPPRSESLAAHQSALRECLKHFLNQLDDGAAHSC